MKSIIKKNSKKALSMFLSFLMIFYLIPVSVFALDNSKEGFDTPQTNITKEETVFELEDRREESVKHFRFDDGSIMAVQYDSAVHRTDENGVWRDIDNRLAETSNDISTSDARVKFVKKTTGNETLFALHEDNKKITLSLDGANKKVYGQVSNHSDDVDATQLQKLMNLENLSASILYPDILDGVDLEYVVVANNIKENIIVKERTDAYAYTFTMILNHLTASMEDSGQIVLVAGDGEVCYVIPSGMMMDAVGNISYAVDYVLTDLGNGSYSLGITADDEWINAEERVFPVTIDPPIYPASQYGAIDLTISQSNSSFNDCASENLIVSNSYISYWKANDLPTLPVSAYITEATFHAQVSMGVNDTAYVAVYDVLTAWDDSLTWADVNKTMSPEGKLANDYTDYCRIAANYEFDSYSWNITPIAKKWYAVENYGLALKKAPGFSFSEDLTFSSNNRDGSEPILCISYVDMKGLEDYWSYSSQSNGFAGSGSINHATGELTYVIQTLSTLDSLLPFTPTLVYQSSLANKNYVYGNVQTPYVYPHTPVGFKLNIQETLLEKQYFDAEGYPKNMFILADADGTEHYFMPTDDSSVYHDEDGLLLELKTSGSLLTITDSGHNVRAFQKNTSFSQLGIKSAWYLESITDQSGNKISFAFDSAKRPTAVQLTPNGFTTPIEQLKLGYGSSGRLNIVYNPHSNEAAILRYSGSLLQTLIRAHGNDDAVWADWQTYANDSTTVNANITVDAQASYTYSSGLLTKTRNELSQYELNYSYTNKKVTQITEKAGATTAPTTGQSVTLSYNATNTVLRTSGSDDALGTSDDLLTTYTFDSFGRAINAYTTDAGGTQLYGASSGEYDEENEKSKNSLVRSTQVQEQSPNYLLNGGFETQGAPIPNWASDTSERDSLGTSREGANHGEACVRMSVAAQDTTYNQLLQYVNLPAGTYTLTMSYKTKSAQGAALRMTMSSIYDTQGVYKDVALNSANLETTYQQASLQFTVPQLSSTSDLSCTVMIELILTDQADGYAIVCLDDLMLSKSTGAMAYDMVQMGHFEDTSDSKDISDIWSMGLYASVESSNTVFGNVLKLTAPSAHTSSASATHVAYSASSALKSQYASGGVTLTPMYFTVSGWAKSTASSWNQDAVFAIRVRLWYYNGVKETEGESIYFHFDRGTTDWQFISGSFVTDPSKGLLSRIYVVPTYYKHPGDAYFDNISMVQDSDGTSFCCYIPTGYVGNYRHGSEECWYEYDTENNLLIMASNYGYYIDYDFDSNHRLTGEEYFTHQGVIVSPKESGGTGYHIEFKDRDENGAPDISSRYCFTYRYDMYGIHYKTISRDTQSGSQTIASSTHYADSVPYFGALATYTDEAGGVTRYFYDETNGYLLAVAYPDGNGVTYRYDAIGNLIEVLPAKLVNTGTEDTPVYDYELTELGTNVDYAYDSVTNRLTSINTTSTQYTFVYDVFGNATSITNKAQTSGDTNTLVSYTYNANNGKLDTMTYGNGLAVKYTYDALDRISEIWYNTGTNGTFELAYSYRYDYAGRLYSVEDHTGGGNSMVNVYDPSGRPVQSYNYDPESKNMDLLVDYLYDEESKLIQTAYDLAYKSPTGITIDNAAQYDYQYNVHDQLYRVYAQFGGMGVTVDIAQNNLGRLDGRTYLFEMFGVPVYYNEVAYEYDSSNARIESMSVTRSMTPMDTGVTTEYHLTYDANGNITHIRDKNGNLLHQYAYDTLGQLIRETNYSDSNTSTVYQYTYNAAGNRTRQKISILSTTATYSGDRLTKYGSNSISYDELGNVIQFSAGLNRTQYEWQGRLLVGSNQRVSSVTTTTTVVAAYTYNSEGIRTSKTVNGIKHEYILDGSCIVAEKWVENNVEYMMVFLYDDVGSPIGFLYRTSAYARGTYDAYFYEKNFFGDVIGIYDESGSCVAKYNYNAWGVCTVQTNVGGIATLNPIRYRSYYYDTHTGLYYLQSRYYNPDWGRFISPDCYVSTGQGLLGNNMYLYCNNNPIMGIDPTGEWAFWDDFCDFIIQARKDLLQIWDQALNQDGSRSLYDNQRFGREELFHEQIFVVEEPSKGVDVASGSKTFGGSFTLVTGGWEWDNVDLSLFDFAKASAELSYSDTHFSGNIGISAWSPSISFDAFGGELSFGVNLGVMFGFTWGQKKELNLGVLSISFSN